MLTRKLFLIASVCVFTVGLIVGGAFPLPQVFAQEEIRIYDGVSMLALYWNKTGEYVGAVTGTHSFTIDGKKLIMDDYKPVVNDLGRVGYLVCEYKRIDPVVVVDEDGMFKEVPQNIADLGLVPYMGSGSGVDAIEEELQLLKTRVSELEGKVATLEVKAR